MELGLGLMQFIVIGIICILEFNKRSPAVFLWATLFLMFGIMHFLATVQGDIDYSGDILNEASLFVIFFCIIYFLTRFVILKGKIRYRYVELKKERLEKVSKSVSKDTERCLIISFFLITGVKLYSYIERAGGILNTSWGSARESSATMSYLNLTQPIMICFLAFSGLALYEFFKKKYFLACVLITTLLVNVVITRNRVEVIPVLGIFITIYLMKIKKINMGTCLFVAVVAVGAIYLIYGLRAFRWYGTLENFIETFEFDAFMERINTFLREGNGELGLRRYMYYFISKNNNFQNFEEMATYKRMLMVLIPTRWSFGLKPTDFAISMGAAVGLAEGGSMHPTLFGDCYANAGSFGIFLGAFWAMFVSYMDKILLKFKDTVWIFLVYVLQVYMYVIIGRGAVYNGWVMAAFGMIFLWICSWIQKKFYIKKKNFYKLECEYE